MLQLIATKKKELILTLFSGFIALFIGIFGFETYFQYKTNRISAYQFDSELGWSPIPNKKITINSYSNFQLNSLGFRSEEIDNSKEHILVLGDSVAWGFGTKDQETIPYYLNQRFPSLQVLNMAVSGYGIGQSYLFLKKHIDKLNPKLIIFIIYTGNDLHETGSNKAFGKNKPIFVPQNNQIKLTNGKISKFSCINLIHGSHLLKNPFFNFLKNGLCEIKTLNLDQATQVISTLFQKINMLGLKKNNAKTLFIVSPSRNDLKIEICKHNPMLDYCLGFQKLLFSNPKNNSEKNAFPKIDFKSINLKPLGLSQPLTVNSIKKLEWGGGIIFRDILKTSNLNYLNYSSELAQTMLILEKIPDLYLDNAHYSPLGNMQLANSIANGLRKNHWMDN
jgi:lysophospholipase L1-like esterase